MTGLKREIAAYERMRHDLEREHVGRWVVVHNEKLAGMHKSFQAAAENAVSRFGRGPYLIRRIGAEPLVLPPYVQLAR